jgi:hypothetical protein
MPLIKTPVGLAVATPNLKAWLLRFFAATLICGLFPAANAQRWKDELKAEQEKNTARIAAIDAEAEPLGNQLRQVQRQIDTHNANQCTAPSDNPGACAAYNREAAELNSAKQDLVSRLKPLAAESDRLIARNKEIARRLRCVPIPNACKSDSDCNECSSCGTFDGRGKEGVCQPLP